MFHQFKVGTGFLLFEIIFPLIMHNPINFSLEIISDDPYNFTDVIHRRKQ